MSSNKPCGLDMSFASNQTTNTQMDWAFTDDPSGAPSGTWVGQGHVKEQMPKNSPLHFSLFDTASYGQGQTPPGITQVTITSKDKKTGAPASPFSGWQNNPATFTPGSGLIGPVPNAYSTGLNLQNVRGWQVGPFVADKKGHYGFTVGVSLDNGNHYSVDPEVVVTGDK